MAGQHRGLRHNFVDQATLSVFLHFAQVVVLDRVLVGVEFKRTAHRLKLGLFDVAAQRFFVFQIAKILLGR